MIIHVTNPIYDSVFRKTESHRHEISTLPLL